MNKKFSTLVASLLLTSAFSVYSVDAKPMLATPTQVETRASLPAEVEDAVEVGTIGLNWGSYTTLESKVLPGFTNKARLAAFPAGNYTVNGSSVFVHYENNEAWAWGTYPSALNGTELEYYWSYRDGQLVNEAGQDFSVDGISEFFEIVPLLENGEPTNYFAIATRANGGKIQYVTNTETTTPTATATFGLTVGSSTSDYTAEIAQAAIFCSLYKPQNQK